MGCVKEGFERRSKGGGGGMGSHVSNEVQAGCDRRELRKLVDP